MKSCLPLFKPFFSTPKSPQEIHLKAIESFNLGDIDTAKTFYEESIKLFEKKGEYKSVAVVYSDLALLHFNKKNYDEAINCYEKSQQFFEKDGYSFLDISKVKLKIASGYCEKNELDKASSYIDDAITIAEQPSFRNNNRTLVEIYSKVGNLHIKMNAKKAPQRLIENPLLMDIENSLLTTQLQDCYPPSPLQSVGEDSSFENDHLQTIILTEREDFLTKNENKFLSKSIEYLLKSITNSNIIFYKSNDIDSYDAPKIEDAINYVSNCINLGLAYKENNNNCKALEYIDKSLIIFEQLKENKKNINHKDEIILKTSIDKICNFIDNISISYFNLEEKKSLQKICQKLLVVVEDEEKREKISEKIKSLEDLSPPSQFMHLRDESQGLAPELLIKSKMFKKM